MSDRYLLFEAAQKLGETRRILEGTGTSALAGVATALVETAESLTRTAREVRKISCCTPPMKPARTPGRD